MSAPTFAAGYELGELLGRGGMGSVYAAEQPALGRTVAVKLLHPEFASTPSIVERFHTEALAGSRLAHPNVARVIDYGVTGEGTPYLVMEHVGGRRLGAILEREGALPPHRACGLVLQLLAALEATHAANVIHADVKCDNILVDPGRDGRETAVLIDFGIARLVDLQPPDAGGREHVVSGTAEYLAPELISGSPPTVASDLYAAGVVLYELLTGEPPFHGGSSAAVFQRHVSEEVIAPSLRQPDFAISTALDRVVLRALAKAPELRFASAAELADALIAAMPGATDAVEPVAPVRGFASEAPTQDWPVIPRRRLAQGTRPQPEHRAERLRAAIGTAIVAGDPDAITTAYLDLARALVAARHPDLAVWELEQAVDVLTAGEGPRARRPPPPLWRVLLALAAIYDGTGDLSHALAAARDARTAAINARSLLGRDRARTLLVRLGREASTVVEDTSPKESGHAEYRS